MSDTFNHPEHGPLTIGPRIGRSRVCTKADGTTVTLSSKLINKLVDPPAPTALIATEDFVESVRCYLSGLGDGPEQTRVARDTWQVCEEFLKS